MSEAVSAAARSGTRRELLVATRDRIARTVDDPGTSPRDLAALTRRLMDIAAEIEAIDLKAGTDNPITEAAQVPDEAM
ncbi:hypothetical protein PROPHIGD12-2_46 [Mycobacterium phage prophiGD12-2]|nr:hypothetical protein PROPHIGD12-2_46 [Mycobacterium phage prophiGD12-2]